MKKTPTLTQVASATVTPAMLQQVLQEVKESIVLLVAEVVSRSICKFVYDILEKKVSKIGLPLKVATISARSVNAANKLKFGTATTPIEKTAIKDIVVEKCFPKIPTPEPLSQNNKGSSAKSQ
jgi:hypothetical protein